MSKKKHPFKLVKIGDTLTLKKDMLSYSRAERLNNHMRKDGVPMLWVRATLDRKQE